MARQLARLLRVRQSPGLKIIPPALPIEEEIEEQILPNYRPQIFYPVSLGEVLAGRYKVISRLGFGSHSTVWFAEDTQRSVSWIWQAPKYSVLKILTNNVPESRVENTELAFSNCIKTADPKDAGLRYLRTVEDTFELCGPDGKHIGLAYQPMREPLSLLQKRLANDRIPDYYLKDLLKCILMGLDYLHTKCRIIHTDLKPDNILIGCENRAILDEFVREEAENPSPAKREGDRFIYATKNLGALQDPPKAAKIADFGLAVWGNVSRAHNHRIQPDLFQAPEVILQAGWTYSADIWNLGVMIWDVLENRTLFDVMDPISGEYIPREHLAQMVSLLGPPPQDLLKRGEKSASYFSAKGKLLGPDKTSTTELTFETSISSMIGEDKELFIEFANKMLQWMPEDRATAADLLQDPWLKQKS